MFKTQIVKRSAVIICIISGIHGSIPAQQKNRVKIEEVATFGGDDMDELYQWAGICSDDEDNIYVTDLMDYSIKKLEGHSGMLVGRTGRRGSGPGEFIALREIKYNNNLLYITDQGNPGIHVFDVELNYKYHINYLWPIYDFEVLDNKHIIIAPLKMDNSCKMTIIDSLGNPIADLSYSQKSAEGILDAVKFQLDPLNNIYLIYTFKDIIMKLDIEGNQQWRTNVYGGNKSVKLKNIKGYNLPEEVIFKEVALDTAGNLFVLSGHKAKNRSRDVYVITNSGEFFDTVTLVEASHTIFIDSKNYLFARAGLGTSIKKYKIQYR